MATLTMDDGRSFDLEEPEGRMVVDAVCIMRTINRDEPDDLDGIGWVSTEGTGYAMILGLVTETQHRLLHGDND